MYIDTNNARKPRVFYLNDKKDVSLTHKRQV